MIKEKEFQIKIAEDKNEAFWTQVKQRCLDSIDTNKHEIEINTHILKLAEDRLEEKPWKK